MNTNPVSAFVSKVVVVGSLCALLWVLRTNALDERHETPGPVQAGMGTPGRPPMKPFGKPKEKEAPVTAQKETDEAVPKAIEVQETPEIQPYRSASERPQLVRSGRPAEQRKESLKMVFPM